MEVCAFRNYTPNSTRHRFIEQMLHQQACMIRFRIFFRFLLFSKRSISFAVSSFLIIILLECESFTSDSREKSAWKTSVSRRPPTSRILILIFVFDVYVISPLRFLDEVKISLKSTSLYIYHLLFLSRGRGKLRMRFISVSNRNKGVSGVCTELLAFLVFFDGNAFSFDSAVIVGDRWRNCYSLEIFRIN